MNDNLYSIEDEKDTQLYNLESSGHIDVPEETVNGNDGYHDLLSEYDIEDEEKNSEEIRAWDGTVVESKPSAIGLLVKILSNPVEGWKELKRCKYSVDKIASGCFYPLVALASISEYTALFYDADSTLVSLIIPAFITFITFFFGYFSVLLCGGFMLPKEARKTLNTYFGKEYVMLSMSTLALFYIVFRLFILAGPIFAFLPLWTIYILCKGVKLFRVPKEKESRTCGIFSALIIGCPIFWNWVFNDLLSI